MPVQTRLDQLAYLSQPVYYMDAALTWEERLARAYDEAAAHVRKSVAPGSSINLAKHAFAADVAGSDLNHHHEAWEGGIESNTDPSLESAIKWRPEDSREYYLGHFAQASDNLGVFISGHARSQVDSGALSPEDFEQACELRLRALSDIIYAGRTGSLPALIDADGWNRENGASDDGRLIVATSGVGTPSAGAQGLGLAPMVVIGIVAVVGLLVGVGIGVAICMAAENIKQRRAALDICKQAIRDGHKDADKICGSAFDFAKDMAEITPIDSLVPKGLQQKILLYGAIGVGGLIFINFLPNIAQSLARAQGQYSDERLHRLRRLQEQSD